MEQVWPDVRGLDPQKPSEPDASLFELAMASRRGLREINGQTHYLWRAVDYEGEVLESYVTKRRDRKAVLEFLKKSMKRYGNPDVIMTDNLLSYGAAMKVACNAGRRKTGRWLSNRAGNSHLPPRRRERAMLRFRQMRRLQQVAGVHASVCNHFNQERHLNS